MNDRLLSRSLPMLPSRKRYDLSTWEYQMLDHYWDASARVAYRILMAATAITGTGTAGNAATLALSSYYFTRATQLYQAISTHHPRRNHATGAHIWQNLGIAWSGLVQSDPPLEQKLVDAWVQYLRLETYAPDPRIVQMVRDSNYYQQMVTNKPV
jgi:hypothetical protein